MNILPREEKEFARADYWDKFFRERGTKKFEWCWNLYGEYLELCGELHKYVKPKDSILVVGCGNSRLSSDLYDVGYRQITNIDISDVVIKQMKTQLGKERPEMTFEKMDALNMTFEPEKFTVILDKGTLDALMPCDADEDHTRAHKLFVEIDKVLKIGGRYIIISLLQPHVLKRILEHFPEHGWIVRIIRCLEVEKKDVRENGQPGMPVFMVVCTKLKKMGNIMGILEAGVYINDKVQRIQSKADMLDIIKGIQRGLSQLKNSKGEVMFEYRRNGEKNVRYLIHVSDVSLDQKKLKKYGAFIVPQGRENEWMFGTSEGRQVLLKESGYDRLAVIALQREQHYHSKTQIQDELARTILQFAPSFMENSEIPYMTIGDNLGKRETIYRCKSEMSGEMVVEEVEIDTNRFRRLIFMDNQAVVQSEIKLKKDDKNKWKIDSNFISNDLISYLAVAVGLVKDPKSVSVIGLGGGGLCLFLNRMFPSVLVTGVEIDSKVVKVAKEYFGLKEGQFLQVEIRDGVEFLKNLSKQDVIIFDVDSKEQGSVMSSPPPQFLQASVLEAVKNSLGPSGILVVNAVSRVEKAHVELITKLREYFSLITWYDLAEDVNRVLFLSNRNSSQEEWRKSLKIAAEELNKKGEELIQTDSLIDLYHFNNHLTIG